MDSTMIWGLLRLALALVIVVPGAFFVTRWYGKKHTVGQKLRIKEALSLGPNRALYLVEWEKESYLLGVTNQTITLLDHKPDVKSDVEEVRE
ncbi:MAG TPA: FliO/MopB family protein [Firmicutes bacterium]|jgi:flagellar biogenesis protein FliO|nr:FliO/MopB family protein [Bacillota bacterium]